MCNFEIIKHNITLFKKRFPTLANLMQLADEVNTKKTFEKIPRNYLLQACLKNKNALTIKINEKFLHSKYDALAEADTLFSDSFFSQNSTKNNCVFFGLGLGYLVERYIEKFPKSVVTIVEPDVYVFFLFLSSRKLDTFFAHENINLLIGLKPFEVFNFLQSTNKKGNNFFLRSSELILPRWYEEFKTIYKRNETRTEINAKTAKKFFKLWFENLVKNLLFLSEKNTDNIYSLELLKNFYKNTTALIFAGGPSLNEDLVRLSKFDLSKTLIIAVDTATSAVLKAGISPDFIVTGDPQFYNFKHLQNMPLQKTKLVAEISIFPKILRLETDKTFLFFQKLPLEELFFEELKKVNENFALPILKPGGSVSTSAYSLAKFLGAKRIYFSGLDLSFPKKLTHFKGSHFEEATHKNSTRLNSATNRLTGSVLNSDLFLTKGNSDHVLTDNKMQMYAWWFESEISSDDLEVFTFSKAGLYIAGLKFSDISESKVFLENQSANTALPFLKETTTIPQKDILKTANAVLEKIKKNKEIAKKLFGNENFESNEIIKNLKLFLEKFA